MAAIQTLPDDFLEKVEFDRVVALHAAETLGPGGYERALRPELSADAGVLDDKLTLAFDMLRAVSAGEGLPLRAYEILDEAFRMLRVEGYTMALEELVQINLLLRDLLAIYRHLEEPERADRYPRLAAEVKKVPPAPELNKAIDQVIDEEGKIRPNASAELARIRRAQQQVQREVDDKFRGLVQKYRERDLLADTVETFRNGRRVLSVPAANKRKIRGIVHDQSATGQTTYIEPEEVIALNNDLFDLRAEERREVARLLKALSAQLRPELEMLIDFDEQRARFDALRAQAVVARRMRANRPKIAQEAHLELREARHPLLYLKFQQESRKVVPFDLDPHEGKRLVLLSGPNAGGKSILLKAAGLLQVMVQAGLLVPCGEESKFGTFDTFCADIGDQQSLDDDLSTYSSHLRNMREFLAVAGERTFVLIDEFGSGTDPKLGGAVAESILRELLRAGVWGLITTHYGNLKAYVYKQRGVVNAAMVFDADTLHPTYEMRLGKPGSSYAFEVAGQAGLSPKLLEYARGRVRGNEHEVDQLLLDLERERAAAADNAKQLAIEREKIDRLTKAYGRMQRDLEVQRKTFKLETQERALQAEARQQKELERVVREIRERDRKESSTQVVAAAKRVVETRRASRKARETEVATLKDELNAESLRTAAKDLPLEEGAHVRLRRGGTTGVIERIDRGKATIQIGELTMTANLKDLEVVRAPVAQRSTAVKKDLREQVGGFRPEIDVRGFRREEVLNLVQDLVDRAMINGVGELKILHGKGNGTLRRTVREKLKEYGPKLELTHPPGNQGGDGVTLVKL